MAWADQAEVAVIESRKLGFVQAFQDRHDGCVDKADIGIRIPVAQLADSAVVIWQQFHHPVGTGDDVVEQRNEDAGVQPSMDPVVDLDEDRSGYNQGLSG